MKSFVALFSLFCVALNAYAADLPESRKRLPEFNYTQHRDAKVKSNSNLVLITFHSEEGLLKNRKVKIAFASKTYTIQTDSNGMYRQTLTAGKYPFGAWLDDSHEEIKTDSFLYPGGHRTEITIWFYSSIERVICDKPVVYVYCDSAQEIQLGLKVDGQLLFSYPTYTGPLTLKTNPSGMLEYQGISYPYLFWDASTTLPNVCKNAQNGFIVTREELVPFLEKSCEAMHFNARERSDFITYWAPRMMQHEKVYLHFLFNDACNAIAQYTVQPRPQEFFRVYMAWCDAKGMDASKVKPQVFPSIHAGGLRLVEWGGMEFNSSLLEL
jgi:hypothetical protein